MADHDGRRDLDAADIRGVLRRADRAVQDPALRPRRRAFPLTVTGKVQKYKMREHEIEALGLQAAAGAKTA